jgi:HD-like signal output (HDOD) protein
LYGFPSEIQSLSHAISLLGTMTVRNLVLAASMKETYKRFGLMEKRLWQHSSLTGPAAAMLAEYRGIRVDPEIAFTAGLMHHVLSRFCDGASYADRDRLTAAHLAHSAIWPHSC